MAARNAVGGTGSINGDRAVGWAHHRTDQPPLAVIRSLLVEGSCPSNGLEVDGFVEVETLINAPFAVV